MLDHQPSTAKSGRTALVIAAVALVVPLALTPGFALEGWSVRIALLLPCAVVGVVQLVRLVAAGHRPAWAAAALLLTATLSTVVSDAPRSSLVGPHGWFVGLLPLVIAVGVWALGVTTFPDDRRGLLPAALVLGAVLNAVAALLQAVAVFPLNVPDPTSQFGRSDGLLGNPVHLGALCGAGLVLQIDRCRRNRAWYDVLAIGVLACGLNLAGGRAGLVGAVVVLPLALRRTSWRFRGVVVLAIVAGMAVAAVATPGTSEVSTGRIGDLSSKGRPGAWRAGYDALLERPVLGFGPGRFAAASTPRRSLESRRAEPVVFVDAHNVVIEYATTSGLVGLALLLAWVGLAATRARGGLALFALVLALNGLLQPETVATTPLGWLALGASAAVAVPRLSLRQRSWIVALAVGATCWAVAFLVGEVHRARIATTGSSDREFRLARALLVDSPELLAEGSAAALGRGDDREARRLADVAIRMDPSVAEFRVLRAAIDEHAGRIDEAERGLNAALRLDPYSTTALRGLLRLESARDPAAAAVACDRLRELLPRARC